MTCVEIGHRETRREGQQGQLLLLPGLGLGHWDSGALGQGDKTVGDWGDTSVKCIRA
jgi:hypothetical protein